MKRKLQVLLLLVVAAIALFILYRRAFPNEPRLIRQRLAALAGAASFSQRPSALANLAAGEQLRDFFTSDLQVEVDLPEGGHATLTSREDILQAALAARATLDGLRVQFLDVNVTVGPGHETATAHLTVKATQPGDRDFFVQELKLQLRKEEGRWRVFRVETIRTLKL
jgi:hypothetical protein